MKLATTFLALALLAGPDVAAGADVTAPITPDRPDVADSAHTVPLGAFQIETGLEYARTPIAASPAERRLALQALLRAGLTDRLEVRLEGEPLVRLRGTEEATDHGDVALGLKYRFVDSEQGRWWPSLGVQPFVKLPVADAPIGSERPDFGVLALASFDLPWEFDLDVNAGLAAVGQTRPTGYLLQALLAASLGHPLTEHLSAFVELVFASRGERDGRDSLALDAGVLYLVTRRLALDAAAGTALTGRAPEYVLRAGASVRFGR